MKTAIVVLALLVVSAELRGACTQCGWMITECEAVGETEDCGDAVICGVKHHVCPDYVDISPVWDCFGGGFLDFCQFPSYGFVTTRRHYHCENGDCTPGVKQHLYGLFSCKDRWALCW